MISDDQMHSFLATKQWCDDLGVSLRDSTYSGDNGYTYCDGTLFISCTDNWVHLPYGKNRRWHLLIGKNDWFSDDITVLESRLAAFAVNEGYIQ